MVRISMKKRLKYFKIDINIEYIINYTLQSTLEGVERKKGQNTIFATILIKYWKKT